MTDETIVDRIMDKASHADRRALFAALQAALGPIIDADRGFYRGKGLQRVEEALDLGAPFGSPEQIAHAERKARAGSVRADAPEVGDTPSEQGGSGDR